MTTIDKAHDLFMTFDGRSPKQIYIDRCDELGIKSNSSLKNTLSGTVNDFYSQEELKLAGNYFGPKGMKAVLPLLLCHPRLKTVDLRGCGVTDETVIELVEIMLDHGRLREVDLRGNPEISVYSGKPLVKVCKANVNLINVNVTETNIGENVSSVVERMCANNRELNECYFTDNFFRMKDMFIGLDVDGSGWVNLATLVSSVAFPFIQERLRDRIAEVKPRKRGNGENSIDLNTFMPLTYLTWKTKEDIEARIQDQDAKDEVGAMIKGNWATLLAILDEKDVECQDLSKMRVGCQLMSASTAQKIVEEALTKCPGEPAEGEKKNIPVTTLFDAQRLVAPMSWKRARKSSFFSGMKEKTWVIPVEVVKALNEKFGDKHLGYLAEDVLQVAGVETELHKVDLKFLNKQFNQYAIPTDMVLLTIQEIINMVDEYWDVVTLDKKFTLEEVREFAKSAKAAPKDEDGEQQQQDEEEADTPAVAAKEGGEAEGEDEMEY